MNNPTSPNHYKQGGLETWDVIRAWLGPVKFLGYLEGNVIKYISRWEEKNGLEDLEKAEVYLNKMIEEIKNINCKPCTIEEDAEYLKLKENEKKIKDIQAIIRMKTEELKKHCEDFRDGVRIPLPEEGNYEVNYDSLRSLCYEMEDKYGVDASVSIIGSIGSGRYIIHITLPYGDHRSTDIHVDRSDGIDYFRDIVGGACLRLKEDV